MARTGPIVDKVAGFSRIGTANQKLIGQTDDFVWHAAATELAAWTEQRMVNRTDVWGAYSYPKYRRQGGSNSFTAPSKKRRGQEFLGSEIIKRHYQGTSEGHVIGLHAIGVENTSKWIVIDIDKHGNDLADATINFVAAKYWYDRLTSEGFKPLLSDSNGAGGFHLLVVFTKSIPSIKAFNFGRWIVHDYADRNLSQAPESFPKQPDLNESRPFGSWCRLPGRHHTRQHWTRVWNGSAWLEGREAIDTILSTDGDTPSLIPGDMSIDDRRRSSDDDRNSFTPSRHRKDHWLQILSGCDQGCRHVSLTQFAGHLLGHGIDRYVVAAICVMWNERRNRPPLPEGHVVRTVTDLARRNKDSSQRTPAVIFPEGSPQKIKEAFRRHARGKL